LSGIAALRIAKSERLQQHRIDHAEHGCDRANAQRQRKDGRQREPRRLAQPAHGIPQLAKKRFNRRQSTLHAVALSGLRDAAELAQRRYAGLLRRHAVAEVLLDGKLDVRAQLFVEIGVEPLFAEKCGKAAKESANPIHGGLLVKEGLKNATW
jgi:hypothetical protein